MQRSDGSSFKNAGDCVSYFAQTNKTAACVVTATSGCLTFDNVVLTAGSDTLTLNAAYSFNSTCTGACIPPGVNNDATGGGSYLVTDSTGATVEQGTLTTADTGIFEGLAGATYNASDTTPTTCSAAVLREVAVFSNTNNVASDPYAVLGGLTIQNSPSSSHVTFSTSGGLAFGGASTGVTITC